MIRTTRFIQECKCDNCGIIHLLGETFQGQRCCQNPRPFIIGKRKVPFYSKTIEEEKQEAFDELTKIK